MAKKNNNFNPRKKAEKDRLKKEAKELRKKRRQLVNKVIALVIVVAVVLGFYFYFKTPEPKTVFDTAEQTHTIDLSDFVKE